MSGHASGETVATDPDCWLCAVERDEDEPHAPFWSLSVMHVCPTCGNKRCPKATDHRLDCTGSNEPGQAGSRYGVLFRRSITDHPEDDPAWGRDYL